MLNRLISVILILLLSPVFVICALAIWIEDGSPVLFVQKRVGKEYSFFNMYKFRSMRLDTPNVATHLLQHPEQYVLKTGKMLRKLSLDELPNLFNILKGEMCFVGPRPALFNQDDLMKLRINAGVHTLMPGVTGWAQVNGRDELKLEQKVSYEKEYMLKRSILFDFYIIFLTLTQALTSKGVKH
jgi:O-antigen biosynthesis protein WbqP